MTSLTSQNPHAVTSSRGDKSVTDSLESISVAWRLCSGCSVSDDSKHILAVKTDSNNFIMADVRFVREDDRAKGNLVLELFFDGECKDLLVDSGIGYSGFLEELQLSVQRTVQTYYERRLQVALSDPVQMKSFRSITYPDVTISLGGSCLDASFRDAGCMLSFIAVRVSLSSECARAIGGIVFPETFGMPSSEVDESTPIPKWLMGMGVATVVVGIGTIYAWAQVLLNGNQYS